MLEKECKYRKRVYKVQTFGTTHKAESTKTFIKENRAD